VIDRPTTLDWLATGVKLGVEKLTSDENALKPAALLALIAT
jgi:hypothetical protein